MRMTFSTYCVLCSALYISKILKHKERKKEKKRREEDKHLFACGINVICSNICVTLSNLIMCKRFKTIDKSREQVWSCRYIIERDSPSSLVLALVYTQEGSLGAEY